MKGFLARLRQQSTILAWIICLRVVWNVRYVIAHVYLLYIYYLRGTEPLYPVLRLYFWSTFLSLTYRMQETDTRSFQNRFSIRLPCAATRCHSKHASVLLSDVLVSDGRYKLYLRNAPTFHCTTIHVPYHRTYLYCTYTCKIMCMCDNRKRDKFTLLPLILSLVPRTCYHI